MSKQSESGFDYERKFPKSKALFERAKLSIPGGVNSTARATWSGWTPYPLFVHHGEGSHLFDVEGNEYIDYLLGLGPMLLGHRHPAVTEAVVRHIREVGTVFAMPCELDTAVAEKMARCVPSVEQVRLVNSGTEAVLYATRLARAFTGRKKILRFEGMYHGFSDGVYWSKHPSLESAGPAASPNAVPQGPGMPEHLGDSLVICQWNDRDALEKLIEAHKGELAAVITEPMMCNTGCILPEPGYLEFMREITARYGILLIFDEVITGFRVALGGAQGYFKIKPDLSVFAKGMGGGFAVAAIGGSRKVMSLVADGTVSIAGTYSGNGVAISAASAALDELMKPGTYESLFRVSKRLTGGLAEIWKRSSIPAYLVELGPLFQIWFADKPIKNYRDAARYANHDVFRIWWEEMLARNVLFHPHAFENLFVSTAHSDKDVDETLSAAESAVKAVEKRLGR
jgi:glutamate-1-semialdehyde 2,1-aminomutase